MKKEDINNEGAKAAVSESEDGAVKPKIGTLGEHTLHAALKRFFEPNESFHEVKYKGYVADIKRGDEIIEIQTRALNALREKLSAFLADCKVTVVHPIVREKWLCTMDAATGKIAGRRKSPKSVAPLEAFAELYRIKMFLCDPNLTVCLVPVDVEEYRLLGRQGRGRKKGAIRVQQVPTGIGAPIYLHSATDYAALLSGLPDELTAAELATAKKLALGSAQIALNVLCHVGAVSCTGKKGRAKLYKIRTDGENDI